MRVGRGHCIFKVIYLLKKYLLFSYLWVTYLLVYKKCYFFMFRTLNSILCCTKIFFPLGLSVWWYDKFNCNTNGKHCMWSFFIFLEKIEMNKSVFCASGFSYAQCSDPFCIFTLVIVIIQYIKCVRMTSCTNTDDTFYYYHEMLHNGYFSTIVFHCNRFG